MNENKTKLLGLGNGFRRRSMGLGFTLVEMLVVISIIVILLVVAAPAIFKGVQATKLTGAGERLLGALSEAQQTAATKNYPVEMRFYKYDGQFPGSPAYRGYQLFKLAITTTTSGSKFAATSTKITECVKLPDGVLISPSEDLSPVLSGAGVTDTAGDSGVTGAKYVAIRFMTDGTCRKLSGQDSTFQTLPKSYLTLVEDDGKDYTGNGATKPKNFFTIQTDPYTGKSRSYRPGF